MDAIINTTLIDNLVDAVNIYKSEDERYNDIKVVTEIWNLLVPEIGDSTTRAMVDALFLGEPTDIIFNGTELKKSMAGRWLTLTSLKAPELTTIIYGAFQKCIELYKVYIPKVTQIEGFAFEGCKKLEYLDLPMVNKMGTDALAQTGLKVLILRNPGMVDAYNVVNNTPIALGKGYIYVPKNLVENYKKNSKWSTYANQFRAIEDYPAETTPK